MLEHATAFTAREIIDDVGDVARPHANVKFNRDLAHIPGKSGTLNAATTMLGAVRHGARYFAQQVDRYGPVFRGTLGVNPAVFVCDADMVAGIGRNEGKVWSTTLAYRAMFSGIMPGVQTLDFLATFDFELHRDVRKVLQPAFSPVAIAGYLDAATRTFEAAIDAWLKRGSVRFKPASRRLFADVAGHILMGVDDPREASLFDGATADMWRAMRSIAQLGRFSPTLQRGMAGYRTLHSALLRQVQARRELGGSDLFSRLCQAHKASELLDDDGLVRLFIGTLLAAFDSTSLGTTSMAYLLATHPEWQERLRQEAQSIALREPGYEGLKSLEQLDWVWKETLRLYPVASGMPRVALREVELGGYRIPPRTFVVALVATALRDPRFWTAPELFDPTRFAADRGQDKRQRAAYMPFGAGAHACIGVQLANLEAKAFWRALLTKARIRLKRNYRARHQFMPLGSVSGDVELIFERV